MNPLSWERRTPKEVLAHWKTSETTGLSEKEAAKRRSTYGTNELAHKKPESLFVSFLNQIQELHAAVCIFFSNRNNQTQICFNHFFFGALSFTFTFPLVVPIFLSSCF